MTTKTLVLAGVLLGLGVLVLGTQWHGIEVAPGVWHDSVGLRQWSVLWVTMGIIALVVAPRLPAWGARVLVLLPLLAWIAWSLRGGGLLPIALAIYAAPTILAWFAGLAGGDALRQVARSVKRGSP